VRRAYLEAARGLYDGIGSLKNEVSPGAAVLFPDCAELGSTSLPTKCARPSRGGGVGLGVTRKTPNNRGNCPCHFSILGSHAEQTGGRSRTLSDQ
jgi:hypothetical protein